MLIRCRRVLVPFAIATMPLVAQSQVLLPASANIQDGDALDVAMFWGSNHGNRAHTQVLYPTADVGLGTGTITSLAFRRASSNPAPNAPTTVTLTIELSVSPVSAANPGTVFAQNHGNNRAIVFQGPVVLPAAPATAWPAPTQMPIVFQTPFAYDGSAGNSLVIDISVSGNSNHQPWFVAQQTIGFGTDVAHHTQSTCTTHEGDISGAYGGRVGQPYPGGVLATSFLGYARKASFQYSLLLLGTQSVGSSFAGMQLPVPLTALGLAANPNCQLAVVPDLVLPMGFVPGSHGDPGALTYGPVTMANNPALVGATFYAQALSLDHDNSMPGPLWFPSMTLRWTFGSGHLPAGGQVTRLDDTLPAAAVGDVNPNTAPVLELTIQ